MIIMPLLFPITYIFKKKYMEKCVNKNIYENKSFRIFPMCINSFSNINFSNWTVKSNLI